MNRLIPPQWLAEFSNTAFNYIFNIFVVKQQQQKGTLKCVFTDGFSITMSFFLGGGLLSLYIRTCHLGLSIFKDFSSILLLF